MTVYKPELELVYGKKQFYTFGELKRITSKTKLKSFFKYWFFAIFCSPEEFNEHFFNKEPRISYSSIENEINNFVNTKPTGGFSVKEVTDMVSSSYRMMN